jgi:hypothetical protein
LNSRIHSPFGYDIGCGYFPPELRANTPENGARSTRAVLHDKTIMKAFLNEYLKESKSRERRPKAPDIDRHALLQP